MAKNILVAKPPYALKIKSNESGIAKEWLNTEYTIVFSGWVSSEWFSLKVLLGVFFLTISGKIPTWIPRLIQMLVGCLGAAHLGQGGVFSKRLTEFLKLSHLVITSVVPAHFSLLLFKMLNFAIFSLESILAVWAGGEQVVYQSQSALEAAWVGNQPWDLLQRSPVVFGTAPKREIANC